MKLLFENWRKYITEVDTDNDGALSPDELRAMADELEPEESDDKIYNVIRDDGEALYFEDAFKKEIHHTSPFIKDIARALYEKAGFTYARRLKQRPDGGTEPSDQPVFLYNGNRQYIKIMKEIAAKHGITINETSI